MPKYEITMNYFESKMATLVVEAKDPDELHDLIGEIDLEYLEENAGFSTCEYEPPIINEYEKVHKDTPVNETIQRAMDEVKTAWEAL